MSKIRESTLSNCEKNFLLKSLLDDTVSTEIFLCKPVLFFKFYMLLSCIVKRLDGRAFDECRNLRIEFGKDWGSCYVSLGKTK